MPPPCWTRIFEHSLIFFRWASRSHLDKQAKYLKYPKSLQGNLFAFGLPVLCQIHCLLNLDWGHFLREEV